MPVKVPEIPMPRTPGAVPLAAAYPAIMPVATTYPTTMPVAHLVGTGGHRSCNQGRNHQPADRKGSFNFHISSFGNNSSIVCKTGITTITTDRVHLLPGRRRRWRKVGRGRRYLLLVLITGNLVAFGVHALLVRVVITPLC